MPDKQERLQKYLKKQQAKKREQRKKFSEKRTSTGLWS